MMTMMLMMMTMPMLQFTWAEFTLKIRPVHVVDQWGGDLGPNSQSGTVWNLGHDDDDDDDEYDAVDNDDDDDDDHNF